MLAVLELANILANGSTANTSVTLDIHVVSKREDNRLDLRGQFASGRKYESLGLAYGHVDGLEDGNGECRGFSCARLRLRNDVASLDDRQNGTLLDSRRFFKIYRIKSELVVMGISDPRTVSINSSQ